MVEYAPLVAGADNTQIDMTYDDGVSLGVVRTRLISGNAADPALLDIDLAAPYDFGTVPTTGSAEVTFTITNNGGVIATAMAGSGLALPFRFAGTGVYPGTTDPAACGATLAPTATCEVVVEYLPTTTGLQTDRMDISYENGAGLTASTRNLRGTGGSPATIVISETDPFDYGTLANTNSVTRIFTISNIGSVTADSLSISLATGVEFDFDGAYPGAGGDCGSDLAPATALSLIHI